MRLHAERRLQALATVGHCEFQQEYAKPFSMLAVADMLGVPEEDHHTFHEGFGLRGARPASAAIGGAEEGAEMSSTKWLDDRFTKYVEDRRREPRGDVLTGLALAKYPDGTTPPVDSIVRIATFLFAAGNETTATYMGTALKYLAEDQELQQRLRDNPDLIPNFLEEVLRIESPTKADSRLAVRSTTLGGFLSPRGHRRSSCLARRTVIRAASNARTSSGLNVRTRRSTSGSVGGSIRALARRSLAPKAVSRSRPSSAHAQHPPQ